MISYNGSSWRARAGSLSAAFLWLACSSASFGADTYANGQLTIPSIVIGSANYTDMVVTVTAIDSSPTAYGGFYQDYYNPSTGRLLVSSAYYAGTAYHNVLVTLGSLVSVGGVTGAPSYDGTNLTIPAVQAFGLVFTNVTVPITIANVAAVGGGLPKVAQSQAIPSPTKAGYYQVTLPVVEYGGHFYTNVVLNILLSQVRYGGYQPADTTLHSFSGNGGTSGSTDAAQPGALIAGSGGNFYGTSSLGGAYNLGTVFEISPAGAVTVLYSFGANGSADGAYPYAGLVQGSDGSLYGTTYSGGGPANAGTAFKLTTAGVETVLHSFSGRITDGGAPNGLMLGSDGNLYGTTYSGGTANAGTVFKLTTAGTLTVLYSFAGLAASDGANPLSGLIQNPADGDLYGTTVAGGPYSSGSGVVFKVNPTTGAESVLYAFTGNGGTALSEDGALPQAPLLLGSDLNFYGTTYSGGTYGAGSVFRLTPTGTETVVYSFGGDGATSGPGDGAYPSSALSQDSAGNFYGTTNAGGAFNEGAVFKLTSTGTETVLHSFDGYAAAGSAVDGAFPAGGLVIGSDGNLYGTSYLGGTNGQGAFYRLAP